MSLLDRLGRSAMFRLEPETAHRMAIAGLQSGLMPKAPKPDRRLAVTVAGLSLPNPVGVAAGFDKDAEVPDALLSIGFGFTEVGTITPRAQSGNPKPRVFRLTEDHGVINRLGFNNGGHDAAFGRLSAAQRTGIIGVNVGANKDSDDRAADYVEGLKRFYGVASYFTVNISSPNTPGLRDLQARAPLADLLARLRDARSSLTEDGQRHVPMFLKIAPDVAEGDLDDIVEEVKDKGLEGIIVSNTTLSREGLSFDPGEAGGLSGRPLFARATIMLAKVRQRAGPDLALFGVGGVEDAATARAKIEAGADAVQLYTGLIYGGPRLARQICDGLSAMLERDGLTALRDWRDAQTAEWAARPLD